MAQIETPDAAARFTVGDRITIDDEQLEITSIDTYRDVLTALPLAPSTIAKIRKFLVAVAGGVAVVAAFVADGEVSLNDMIGIILALGGVPAGVYAARNERG